MGYQRITGELNGLGITVSATTVRKILRQAGIGPAGERSGLSSRAFLRAQANSMLEVDFLTVETISLQRLYVLFFIELGSRRVHLAGCTANPTGAGVTQQAHQVAWTLQEQPSPFRFLIRDRDSKFTRDFDAIFASEGIKIIKTPVRAPKANAIARAVRPHQPCRVSRLATDHKPATPRMRAARLRRPLQHSQATPLAASRTTPAVRAKEPRRALTNRRRREARPAWGPHPRIQSRRMKPSLRTPHAKPMSMSHFQQKATCWSYPVSVVTSLLDGDFCR